MTAAGNVTLDDGSGASPSLTFTDATDETAVFSKADAGFLSITTVAGDGVGVLTGNFKVGNGTPTVTQDGEDGYVEGMLEVDGGIMPPAENVTATNVLTSAECGKMFFLSSATEFATTLPAISTVSSGCSFEFVIGNGGAPSGAAYTVITGNSLENVIVGGIVERETDTGDDGPYCPNGTECDTITFTDGVSLAGDTARLVSDGTYFYLTGVSNTDGGVVPTQAD
jgi:hypothetical protein